MRTPTKTTLDQLVRELMQPGRPAMEAPEMASWMARLPGIAGEMNETMRILFFTAAGNRRVTRYLDQIHRECTLLINRLALYPGFPEQMLPLHQAVSAYLDQLLDELHSSYLRHIDLHEPMPLPHYQKAAAAIEQQTVPLVSAMCTYNADKTLQAIIVGKMTGMLKLRTASWHRMEYLERLQTWILELCKGHPHNITNQLKDLLLRANFNASGFLTYYKAQIDKDLAECFELREKRQCLHRYQQLLSTLTYKHKTKKYDAGQPGIRDILLGYVNAELTCMDSMEVCLTPAVVTVPPETEMGRLPVMISVDVLSFLFKLLVKVGVIHGVARRPLLSFISRSFQTAGIGSASLSVKSIDSKYRQVLSSTAISTRVILSKMLKELDDEFK